jgi:hypothetical protein
MPAGVHPTLWVATSDHYVHHTPKMALRPLDEQTASLRSGLSSSSGPIRGLIYVYPSVILEPHTPAWLSDVVVVSFQGKTSRLSFAVSSSSAGSTNEASGIGLIDIIRNLLPHRQSGTKAAGIHCSDRRRRPPYLQRRASNRVRPSNVQNLEIFP